MRARLTATVMTLALLGCPRGTPMGPSLSVPQQSSMPTSPGTVPTAAPSRSVFVVFTAEETFVIPVDANAVVQRYPGVVVGALDQSAPRLLATLPVVSSAEAVGPAIHVPFCEDASAASKCATVAPDYPGEVNVDIALGANGPTVVLLDEHGQPCSCVAVDGLSDEGRDRALAAMLLDSELAYDLAQTSLDLAEFVDQCIEGGAALPTVAISGGVAYSVGEYNGRDCGGANIFTLGQSEVSLRPGSPPRFEDSSDARCVDAALDGRSVVGFWHDLVADACTMGPDCCPGAGETVAIAIASGVAIAFSGDIDPMGAACGCARTTAVTPARCASPLDPCGSGDAFTAANDMAAWWVTNDESAMLGLRDGALFVYTHDRREPAREERLGLSLAAVQGVEVLPSFPAPHTLAGSVVVEVPRARGEPDTSWGDDCFTHFKAGRLEAAEGACVEGLLAGGSDQARGAMTYTLGRIEEARGDKLRAAAYYSRSLALRPGNATVQARLQAL